MLGKIGGIVGVVGILALAIAIFQYIQNNETGQGQASAQATQIANQSIQIAKQDKQIELSAEQVQILSQQATIAAQKAAIEDQLRIAPASNGFDFSPTATALAIEANHIEATRQALVGEQKQIEAAQTAIAQPPPSPTIIVRVDDVIPKIKGEDGEIQRILNWWREDDNGKKDGELDPSSLQPDEECTGMAWNTNQYGYHQLVVFKAPISLTFADGGWYVKVCVPSNIIITAEDMGRIQADWLAKRYGIDNHPWKMVINQ